MTKDEIIAMAKESGLYIENNEIYSMSTQSDQELTEWIERFAKLVREYERNEIIQILDDSTGYVQMDLIRERT